MSQSDFGQSSRTTRAFHYGIAALSVVAAIVSARLLESTLDNSPIVSLLICAILISAWLGGPGPALFAAAIAIATFAYYLVYPAGSVLSELHAVPRLILFMSVAFFVVGMSVALQRSYRRAERELRETIDTIPILAWHARPDGFVEYHNQRWLDYAGLPIEQSLGLNWKTIVHPNDIGPLTDKWQVILESGRAGQVEARLRRFDEQYRWFLIRAEPIRDESGKVIRWFGTNTDIEDLKRSEDALRLAEAQLTEAQRIAKMGSFCLTLESREVTWSLEAARICGFDNMLTLPIDTIMQRCHPDDLETVRDSLGRVFNGGDFFDHTSRLLMPDGSIKYVRATGRKIIREDGEPQIVGALQDITEQTAAETRLARAQAELAHATRIATLGELSASIAHEVNQPLACIVVNGEASLRLLKHGAQYLDEVENAIESMVSEARRASDVVQHLRSLSKKDGMDETALNIQNVIEDALRLVQAEMKRHRVSYEIDIADPSPVVFADRVQVQQVLINLLMNAIHAMAPVSDRPRHLTIRARLDQNDDALIAIVDSGVGLNFETESRLFEAFFTTNPEGMGMGLSICRSIIQAHGGRIWATNNDGLGATFQFTLRAQRDTPPAVAS